MIYPSPESPLGQSSERKEREEDKENREEEGFFQATQVQTRRATTTKQFQ